MAHQPKRPQTHTHTHTPTQALVHPLELEAWIAGRSSSNSDEEPPLLTDPAALAQAAAAGASSSSTSPPPPPHPYRRITLFSLNDYLGLSAHPDVRRAAAAAALSCGMGPRSSAVVAGGHTHYHRALEKELAALKKTEDAVLFPTGFAANVAVVSALSGVGAGPASRGRVVIFSDELNHASIVDGARLATRGGGGGSGSGNGSGGNVSGGSQTNNNNNRNPTLLRVYRHNDLAHLEQLLLEAPADARKLVVTDSLFSMDGDFADLPGLAALRRKHRFLLVVDEAHATLVCGPAGGSGACEMLGVDPLVDIDVQVGTLSKAFGGLGGFACCGRDLRALLLNRGRSGVFSTALPVPVVAAASAALGAARREPWRRAHVWALARRLGARLGVPALSPVVPLVVGGEKEAVELSARLLQRHGIHCPAIRPPTVPAGTCRLRVTLSAAHSVADVDALADAVKEELGRWGGEGVSEEEGESGGRGASGERTRRRRRAPLKLIRLPFLVAQEERMRRIAAGEQRQELRSRL